MSKTFREELAGLINKHSIEGDSDTPDFILADYLIKCLHAFGSAVCQRQEYGIRPSEQTISKLKRRLKQGEK